MRIVNVLFCLILAVFAIVQYNDPDFVFWFIIYGLAAIWSGFAALMPGKLTTYGALRGLFALCLIGAVVGTVYFWPSNAAWWTKEVIWDNELVREGLGMAIVTAGLISVGVTWWLNPSNTTSP